MPVYSCFDKNSRSLKMARGRKKLMQEELDEALMVAKQKMPGWAYAVIQHYLEKKQPKKSSDKIEKRLVSGPEDAPILFFGVKSTPGDIARGEYMTGPDGATFNDTFLNQLGMGRDDIRIGNIDDDEESMKRLLESLKGKAIIVALSQDAKNIVGEDLVDYTLPHPSVIRQFGDKGEISRKMERIRGDVQRIIDAQVDLVRAVPTKGRGDFLYRENDGALVFESDDGSYGFRGDIGEEEDMPYPAALMRIIPRELLDLLRSRDESDDDVEDVLRGSYELGAVTNDFLEMFIDSPSSSWRFIKP
jgi:hypothetical protein